MKTSFNFSVPKLYQEYLVTRFLQSSPVSPFSVLLDLADKAPFQFHFV